MSLITTRGFRRMAALGLVASAVLSARAYALFPPPFYNPPPVRINGDPVPDPPTLPPPPSTDVPPPPDTPCHCMDGCTHTNSTPEPTTLIAALTGVATLGGMALRRRKK
jgi:hypothetical protein